MTQGAVTPAVAGGAGLPIVFIVDADPAARAAAEAALVRRFGADYRVLTAASAFMLLLITAVRAETMAVSPAPSRLAARIAIVKSFA